MSISVYCIVSDAVSGAPISSVQIVTAYGEKNPKNYGVTDSYGVLQIDLPVDANGYAYYKLQAFPPT